MTDAPPDYEDQPTQPALAALLPSDEPAPQLGDPAGGTPFRISRRGYDRGQVDRYLTEVWDAVQELQTEVTASQQQRQAATDEVQRLRKELELGRPEADVIGNRVGQILAMAEAEADQVREQASAKMARVDQDREALLRDAQQQHDHLLTDARDRAEALVAEARKESAQVREAAHRNVEALRAERSAIIADLNRAKDHVAKAIEQATATPQRSAQPRPATGTAPAPEATPAVVALPDGERATSATR
jgi:cell division septum initiation protein DivIVA